MYEDEDIPEPETFDDDYSDRASAAAAAEMRVERDLNASDLKGEPPPGLTPQERKRWNYQRYIKDYLRVVASIDDNVGRVLDYLDAEGLAENTLVIYTSDQGFFLGDHGWYDKRFMYEESLRMPFIVRYPREIAPGTVNDDMVLNLDFAPALSRPGRRARSRAISRGAASARCCRARRRPTGARSMYYRYWMHKAHHNVYAHYGRAHAALQADLLLCDALGQPGAIDETYEPEWELFDLERDPYELHSVYDDPAYAEWCAKLTDELHRLQAEVGDERYPKDVDLRTESSKLPCHAKETLSSRERVRLALDHQETDRIPIAMVCSGINPPAHRELEAAPATRARPIGRGLPEAAPRHPTVARAYVGPPLRQGEDIWGVRRAAGQLRRAATTRSTSIPGPGADAPAIWQRHRWPSPDWFDYSVLPDRIAAGPGRRRALPHGHQRQPLRDVVVHARLRAHVHGHGAQPRAVPRIMRG